MQKDIVSLFSAVTFPTTGTDHKVDPAYVAIFNREISSLGYTFDGNCLDKLRLTSSTSFYRIRQEIIDVLTDLSGADKRHQTLFSRFPHSTPNQGEYLMARVLGYLQDAINYEPKNFTILSCGHVVDRNLFDLDDFGACPICQRQVAELPWRARS